MPKVTVIMGMYNCAKTLSESIESIIAQTYTDWELIMCDDGSTDRTYEIAIGYSQNHNNMTVIQNEVNMGLSYSLNRCLELAKGKYIARMDADDISLPQRLEKQYDFLEKNHIYQIVGTVAYLIDENGRWGIRNVKPCPDAKDFLIGTQFMHPTVMIRKEVYDRLGGYAVTKETIRAEDYDFFMRAYANSYRGYNLQEYLFEFREDKNTYKRRAYKYRIDEAKIRYKGFSKMGLMPKGYIYVLKPLFVGLISQKILKRFRVEAFNDNN